MNKHRVLRAVGFFVVLAVIVAFLALPDGQAAKGRPVKWQATVTGANLNGGVFVGGQDQVNINNGVGTCAPSGTPYSYIELQVFNPSLQFNMGGFTSSGNAAPSPYGLPNPPPGTAWPQSIADFLNSTPQPTSDYPHIILRFSTCGCDSTATDLMAMDPNGGILPVRMSLLCFSHIWGCPPSSPYTQQTFLNLNMIAHGYPTSRLGGNFDVYIQRIGDVWTAYVNTAFDNSAYPTPPDTYTSADWPGSDSILGQYATCSQTPPNKKGKTTWTTTYHYSWAKAPLQFQVAFKKI